MRKIKNFVILIVVSSLLSSCFIMDIFKAKDKVCEIIINSEQVVKEVVGITEEVTERKSRGLAVTTKTNVQFANLTLEEEMMFSTIDDISFIDIPNVKKSFFSKVAEKVKDFLCKADDNKDLSSEVRSILTQGGKSITILEYKDGKIKATSLIGNFSDELIKKLSEQDIINMMKDKIAD